MTSGPMHVLTTVLGSVGTAIIRKLRRGERYVPYSNMDPVGFVSI